MTIPSFQFQNCRFFLAVTIFFFFFLLLVKGQNLDDKEKIRLDEQTIGIIDTTQVQLKSREKLSSPLRPSIQGVLGLYAKERLWHLPPIYTPQKVDRPHHIPPQNYTILVTSSPGIPIAPYFGTLLAGSAQKGDGYLQFNYQDLDDSRKSNQGTDMNLKAGLHLNYHPLSQMVLSAQMSMRDLPWPLATSEINIPEVARSGINSLGESNELTNIYNLQRLMSNWRLHHWLSDKTQLTADGWLEALGVKTATRALNDRATDLRLNLNIRSHFLNLANPIHFGFKAQYLSAIEGQSINLNNRSSSTLLEFYAKDQFTQVGPFVIGIEAGIVSFRYLEPIKTQNTSEYDILNRVEYTRLQPSGMLTITTQLSKQWRLNLEGKRKIYQYSISELYLNNNYVRLNPFLNPEKSWSQKLDLIYNRGQKVELNLSTFANQINDLIYLAESNNLAKMDESIGEVAKSLEWIPVNSAQMTNRYGLILSGNLQFSIRGKIQFSYQRDLQSIYIPYQAKNRIYIDCNYWLFGVLETELKAAIQIDSSSHLALENTEAKPLAKLPNLIHLRGKIKKSIGQHLSAFVGGAYVAGKTAFLPHYPLRGNYLDLGVELNF